MLLFSIGVEKLLRTGLGRAGLYSTQGPKVIENNTSNRPPNLSQASCDLDLWPLTSWPQSWSFHALWSCTTCAHWHQFCFQTIVFTNLVWDERTDERTDRLRTLCLRLAVWPCGVTERDNRLTTANDKRLFVRRVEWCYNLYCPGFIWFYEDFTIFEKFTWRNNVRKFRFVIWFFLNFYLNV